MRKSNHQTCKETGQLDNDPEDLPPEYQYLYEYTVGEKILCNATDGRLVDATIKKRRVAIDADLLRPQAHYLIHYTKNPKFDDEWVGHCIMHKMSKIDRKGTESKKNKMNSNKNKKKTKTKKKMKLGKNNSNVKRISKEKCELIDLSNESIESSVSIDLRSDSHCRDNNKSKPKTKNTNKTNKSDQQEKISVQESQEAEFGRQIKVATNRKLDIGINNGNNNKDNMNNNNDDDESNGNSNNNNYNSDCGINIVFNNSNSNSNSNGNANSNSSIHDENYSYQGVTIDLSGDQENGYDFSEPLVKRRRVSRSGYGNRDNNYASDIRSVSENIGNGTIISSGNNDNLSNVDANNNNNNNMNDNTNENMNGNMNVNGNQTIDEQYVYFQQMQLFDACDRYNQLAQKLGYPKARVVFPKL